MKKIGLVIQGSLSYSLTFIANEIKVWEAMGFQVVMFCGHRSYQEQIKNTITTVNALPVQLNSFRNILRSFKGIIKLLLLGLFPLTRFIRYELEAGTPLKYVLKRAYKVAHILPEKLTVIHFAFGNVAIHKELVAKSIGAKMSVSFRGADIGILPLSNPDIYRNVWTHADKIHVISNDLKQEVLSYGLSEQKVSVIYQTLDLSLIRPSKQSHVGSSLNIVTVARLHWKKGLEYGLSVIKALRTKGIDCHYTIVGSGEHEWAIRHTIKDLGLTNYVTLTGALSYQKTIDRMMASDLYIQTSVQEGFCNAVMEAQACGLLTISTDAEGINENIMHKQTGWIVPKRDVKAMTDKVLEVLDMPEEEKERIRVNAKQRAEKEFYLKKFESEWENFFRHE